MPLFVAPQPVKARRPPGERTATTREDDDEDDDDELRAPRPTSDATANRRSAPWPPRSPGAGAVGRGRVPTARTPTSRQARRSPKAPTRTRATSADGDDGVERRGGRQPPSGVGAVRRQSGNGGDGEAGTSDDPPNTVVHERAPRSKAERDPDADPGHQRIHPARGQAPAPSRRSRRRPSTAADPDRGRVPGPPGSGRARHGGARQSPRRAAHEGARYTQIAVLEDGVVVEHFVTSAAQTSLVGNVYLGIVQNVLPSMEAAFVDIGRGRNGVLYAGEVNWEAAGLGGAERKIEQALKPGDYVVVQVSKDPVGHKGARLTTQVSLAGRYLVLRAGWLVHRDQPQAARHRAPAAQGDPARDRAVGRRRDHPDRLRGRQEEELRGDVERLQERSGTRSPRKPSRSRATKPAPPSRSTRSPTSWSRWSATCSTKTSPV